MAIEEAPTARTEWRRFEKLTVKFDQLANTMGVLAIAVLNHRSVTAAVMICLCRAIKFKRQILMYTW
jgi:hypothetical protein